MKGLICFMFLGSQFNLDTADTEGFAYMNLRTSMGGGEKGQKWGEKENSHLLEMCVSLFEQKSCWFNNKRGSVGELWFRNIHKQ